VHKNQLLGKYGEDRAADYFLNLGYEVIDRNWRCAEGEIDLITFKTGRFVFTEVKTRSGRGYGHPFEAITAQKVQRMRRLVALWCEQREKTGESVLGKKVRLDAISVLVTNGKVAIEHLKQVY